MTNKKQRHPGQRLSLLGLVCGAVSWAALLLLVVTLALPANYVSGTSQWGGCILYGNPLIALAGLALGIGGMHERNPDKLIAIAGVVVPGLGLIAEVLLYIALFIALGLALSGMG